MADQIAGHGDGQELNLEQGRAFTPGTEWTVPGSSAAATAAFREADVRLNSEAVRPEADERKTCGEAHFHPTEV